MIERRFAGILPPKPHTAFRDAEGKLFYEEMFTRGGFSGAFTYFYHRSPITPTRDVAVSDRGFLAAVAAEDAHRPLKRRLYDSNKIPVGGQAIDARVPVLFNRDVTVYLVRATEADDAYFANGDGDELWYVQDGSARLESPCGWLDVKSGDYVWVPHSMMHRWHPKGELRAMVFEAPDGVMIPHDFRNPVGQLKMDAPYTHRDFVHPEGPLAQDGPRTLLAKKGGVFSRYTLAHAPMDVVGWDGFVYPWAFAIEKYQPKTGLVHLPPTVHSTFASPGFLVCSFVPRLVDFHPQAIPCPYPHSSVDCDEIILYLRGNFTSRRGVGPGCISIASCRHRARPASRRVRRLDRRDAHRRARRDDGHVQDARPHRAGEEHRGRRLPRELGLMRALPLVVRCHEDFGAMTGDGRARVCDQCGERVHDLSAQSEEDAEAVLASPETKCVRFAVDRGGNIRFAVASVVAVTLAASGIAMASSGNDTPTTPTAGDAGKCADAEWMGRK